MRESRPAPNRWQVGAAFAAVYIAWGSTYYAIRVGIETLPPFLLGGIRYLIAGVLLYGWLRWRGVAAPARAQWRPVTIVGALLLLGGNGGVCWAEQRVPSGLTALLLATTPLWMALLDWLWHGATRPGFRMICGLGLGFAGAGLLVAPGQFAGGGHIDPVGGLVLFVATVSWATGSLYSRRANLPASPLLATAMEMLAGGALLVVASGITGEWGRLAHVQVSLRSALALAYLIVFGSLVGFTAYVWLLRVTTIVRASTYAFANPLIAVTLGATLAGEPVTVRVVLAGAAIISAVIIIISHPAPTAEPETPASEPV